MQNFSASPREMVASLWHNKGLIRNLIHREVVETLTIQMIKKKVLL